MDIREKLFSMKEEKYGNFSASLMPDMPREKVIGVRIPKLRALAKEISGNCTDFLYDLPHEYFEENNLHAFIISLIKDFDKCVAEVDRFLPYIDNWATCDSLRPPCFAKNKGKLLEYIYRWIVSDDVYTVRFAIEMLMVHYLGDDYSDEYSMRVAAVRSDEYYVNMMIGWYFATALTKRWDSVISFLEGDAISPIARKMAIKKGIESLAITNDKKAYLRELSQK
jgi:3-methyladenine DNA glycosylase AlkD